MTCKQTINGRMSHDMQTNNYWTYVAYINRKLLDVCSMISKQTITGRIRHDM